MSKKYDFGVIGSGPAGYTAAIRASQLGKSVVLFEKKNCWAEFALTKAVSDKNLSALF